jgi:hypothetical protein
MDGLRKPARFVEGFAYGGNVVGWYHAASEYDGTAAII